MARSSIKFLRNGRLTELNDFGPTETVLDYLRLKERNCGTKEGCNEGDCGACTVVIGTPVTGNNGETPQMKYEPVNSCIQFVGSLDGKELITVEDLKADDGSLHPVQQALVDLHGSQCGFCTPGFVMSLYALYLENGEGDTPDRDKIMDQISGNLCRCTGYRPIVDAAIQACRTNTSDTGRRQTDFSALLGHKDNDIFVGSNDRFFAAPASLTSLIELYDEHKDATLIAGTTDVGLWVTKALKDLPKIIYLGRVKELLAIDENENELTIGAAVTYANAYERLAALDVDIDHMLRRLGSTQVRAAGTVGGNIANGSPIGDTPPVLITLGAEIELMSSEGTRRLNLEDFFIRYGQQDIKPGEVLTKIFIPKPKANQHLRIYKISKRFDQDISALLASINLTIDDDVVTDARIAFGGMAEIPKRAMRTEEALIGIQMGDSKKIDAAIQAIKSDYTPISDMRASDEYRIKVAKNLIKKALVEIGDNNTSQTRVYAHRAQSGTLGENVNVA